MSPDQEMLLHEEKVKPSESAKLKRHYTDQSQSQCTLIVRRLFVIATAKVARATARKLRTFGRVRLRLNKPHAALTRSAPFNSAVFSSLFALHTSCYPLTYPDRMKALVELAYPGNRTRAL